MAQGPRAGSWPLPAANCQARACHPPRHEGGALDEAPGSLLPRGCWQEAMAAGLSSTKPHPPCDIAGYHPN